MRIIRGYCSAFAMLVLLIGCGTKTDASRTESQPSAEPSQSGRSKEPREVTYTERERLSWNGYLISKQFQMVRDEGFDEPARNSFVSIKCAGKEVARFDNLHLSTGNATDFTLLEFLGGKEKQLVVSQTGPRDWVHWIVDLSDRPRVIFFSRDYEVNRELGMVDIDGDGVQEITQAIIRFDYFNGLSHSVSPLPTVVFKYDQQAKKYVPACRVFADWLLAEIESDKARAIGFEKAALSAPNHSNDHYYYVG
ncbi:MAG TPA: hypothetical protein VID27_01520, partial [Blastocatellia bacterium]